jgi:hypothetical protein
MPAIVQAFSGLSVIFMDLVRDFLHFCIFFLGAGDFYEKFLHFCRLSFMYRQYKEELR